MKFLKDNLDSIIKLIVNQVGIAILTIFLYTAAGAIKSETGGADLGIKIGISIFGILFYYFLVYSVVWEIGAKDKIRIDAGRAEKKLSRGFLLGLYSNIPNLIIVGLAVLCMGIYMMSGIEGFKTTFGILNLIIRIFISIYLGVVQGISQLFGGLEENLGFLLETVAFFVLPLISSAVTHLAYVLGLNNKRIFGTTYVAKKKNSSDKK